MNDAAGDGNASSDAVSCGRAEHLRLAHGSQTGTVSFVVSESIREGQSSASPGVALSSTEVTVIVAVRSDRFQVLNEEIHAERNRERGADEIWRSRGVMRLRSATGLGGRKRGRGLRPRTKAGRTPALRCDPHIQGSPQYASRAILTSGSIIVSEIP